jgi:hypothetical protein
MCIGVGHSCRCWQWLFIVLAEVLAEAVKVLVQVLVMAAGVGSSCP